ncbi:MAG: OmpA family protein [Myxococcota bacterium]
MLRPTASFVTLIGALLLAVGSHPARAQTPPPESLLIRVTPDDKVVRKGEVITFVVEVANTSTIDLLRDGPTGGVGLQMRLPEGFAYVEDSGRIELMGGDGQVVRAANPSKARKEPRLLQDRDGNAETLNLGANRGLRFTYQITATPAAKPMSSDKHVVWLVDSTGGPLSNEVEAQVKVEADPELDLSIVLGTVWCDADGDGHHDEGERGLGGVRFVSDDGRVVDSDRDGRWHIKDLRPGAHVVKLDAHTLPPGSTLTTPVRVLKDLTPGLPATAEFGVRCKTATSGPTEVEPAPGTAVAPVEAAPFHTVRGHAGELMLAIDGLVMPSRRARLGIETGKLVGGKPERVRTTNVSWRPGALDRPITFRLDVDGDLPDKKGASWRLDIAEVLPKEARTFVRAFSGRGLPPTSVTWDGMDGDNETGVLRRGSYYEARLTVADGKGDVVESAPVWIGASFGADMDEDARTIVREGLFDKAEMPSVKLQRALQRAAAQLKKHPGARILVEVHVAASTVAANDLVKTRRGAFNIGEFLKKGGVASDRVLAVGYGGTRPLRPNVGDRNRAFNERVEIAVLPAEGALDPLPDIPDEAASVVVQGDAVKLESDLAFVVPVAKAPVIAVSMKSPDGSRRSFTLGAVQAPAAPTRVDEGGAIVLPGADDKKPPAPTPDASAEVPDDTLMKDPLRNFGGPALKDALGPGALVTGAEPKAAVPMTCSTLEVTLPEKGQVLDSPRLWVSGTTDRKNTITVGNQTLRVDAAGRFGDLVLVPTDLKELVVTSTDQAGNVARVRWPLTVSTTEVFVLALVDGVGGQVGARLEELDGYEKSDNGDLFIAGRGALYAKARISGSSLAKDIFVTAHVDTQRKHDFEPFFEQVIDPTRDYVIFGDASDDIRDANARGPFYIMVEADRSKIMYGSFRTDIEGLQLLRYDRALMGAKMDLDFTAEDGWHTRAKAFLSDENRRLVRRHDELRATGGSLYYTSAKDLVEGSEKVSIVLREIDTGIELGRAPLVRDTQYRIDYPSGRIMTSSPVSAVSDSLMQIDGFQPFTGHAILDGNAVYLEVDYESRAVRSAGDVAFGLHATQEIAGIVEVGGGIVREGRPAGQGNSDDDYLLYGAQASVKLSKSSKIYGEWASSRSKDGVTQVSTDGGLRYRALDRAPDDDVGHAATLGLVADVGEIAGVDDLDVVVRAHWQMLEAGFSAVGSAREEATEKWGGDVVWKPSDRNRVELRYDGGTTLVSDDGFADGLRAVARNRFYGRYDHRIDHLDLFGELVYGEHRDDLDGIARDTSGVSLGGRLRLGSRVTLLLSQDALFGGDDAILGDSANDRLTTNAGFEVKLAGDLAIRALESVRWNGDNATRLGLVTRLDANSRMYVEERLMPGEEANRMVSALVVGGDTALGNDGKGRAYGEYRLDGGLGGHTNEAVVGLGRSFDVTPGVRATFGYERSQSIDAPDSEPTGIPGGGSRDVLSGGLEVLVSDVVKFGGLYELRYDRDRPGEAATELFQTVARNGLDVKLGEDVTLMGVFNYALSQDLDTRTVVREDLEATAGISVRPLSDDDLVFIARFSQVGERANEQSVSLLGETLRSDESRTSSIFSIAAVIGLVDDLSLTEKLVWRFTTTGSRIAPNGHEDELLWINRLAWELIEGFELAGEFRLVAALNDLAIEKNGGLVELGYTIADHARLGVGWSIDGFAGGLLPGEQANDVDNGFFVRLTGMY